MTTQTLAHPTSLGDVILREHYDADGQPESLEVLQADPRVLISGHLLREVHAGRPREQRVPTATVDRPEVGGIFRINAANRQLIYLLTEYEPVIYGHRAHDTFVGEWPDL